MAEDRSWSVKGVDEETRDVARQAAQQAGMPLGAWVDRAILVSAPGEPAAAPATLVAVSPPMPRDSAAGKPPKIVRADVDRARTVARAPLPSRWRSRLVAAVLALGVIGAGVWAFTALLAPPAPHAPDAVARDQAPAEAGTAGRPMADGAPESLEKLAAAARGGDPQAQFDLGVRYAAGRGVTADATQAAHWFKQAAQQGLANAQFNLGVLFERGEGVKPDDRLAFFWYQSAAEQGHFGAQHNLATAYGEGRGTPRNYPLAARWFRKAADGGIAASQFSLGRLYQLGLGVPKDLDQAAMWFDRAAAQDYAPAREQLRALAGPASPAPPLSREAIAEIQKLLTRLSFAPGRSDGTVSPETGEAIRLFQQFAGASVDGLPSAELLAELRQVAAAVAPAAR